MMGLKMGCVEVSWTLISVGRARDERMCCQSRDAFLGTGLGLYLQQCDFIPYKFYLSDNSIT